MLRVLIYAHLFAVALMALAEYADHVGLLMGIGPVVFVPVAIAALSLSVFPIVLLLILLFSSTPRRQKFLAVLAEIPITFVHLLASLPMVQ